jgi:Na+-translocating ferredoxin:NAD+ oxidoreductase RnfG subunit
MEQQVVLVIIGCLIGLISALVSSVFQHRLARNMLLIQLNYQKEIFEKQILEQQKMYERHLSDEKKIRAESEIREYLLLQEDPEIIEMKMERFKKLRHLATETNEPSPEKVDNLLNKLQGTGRNDEQQ